MPVKVQSDIITLIGYRGCGKTSVAQRLARLLDWYWVDADVVIEQRAGKTIAQIFADEGESHFRQLEFASLQELLTRERLVIAAGGGAILNEQTRNNMKDAGPVVWLTAETKTLAARIAGDELTGQRRPGLTDQGALEEIETVLATRLPLYEACATMMVSTDNATLDEVASQIFARLPEAMKPQFPNDTGAAS